MPVKIVKTFICDLTYYCMIHQCYYCEQIFDTKERLYDHLEIHAHLKDIDNKKSKK